MLKVPIIVNMSAYDMCVGKRPSIASFTSTIVAGGSFRRERRS